MVEDTDRGGSRGSTSEVTLPASGVPVMMKTSLTLPFDMYEQVREAAEARGVGVPTLILEWISVGLTAEISDEKISLAQLRSAIANLVQSGHAG